ncbi:hypothetical protein IFM89_022863 [Coptis chinensis]|uniref:NAD-dependent epimerase/dehydratase domain-containing protein n=1 Tax=Coptis chinensis TaxID=261450 RepID=A0A835LSG4_9MAGN|nr:hypothetical protein IFM89_022863 [Coptis chinensis]
MSSEGAGKTVCVTGASGYIASWLVKLLLQRGYTVKASVRDPNDPKKTEHLLRLPGAHERLQLFQANLMDEGCFDSILAGCEGVFHTASPCFMEATDPQTELIEPAVKGTLNVLSSSAKTPSVKRVVVTSSMASVNYNRRPKTPEVTVDETWFADQEFCKESKFWYMLSKSLAEEAAWKFAKEHGIDMITIHPSVVIGPLLQPTLNESASMVLNLINGMVTIVCGRGKKTYPNLTFGWVDVREVVNAHILAFEVPSAHGRYCVVGRVAHYSEIVKILQELYPCIQLPQKCADDKPFEPTYTVSKEKTESLGIVFTPLEVSLKDIVESLREKKFISF